MKDKRMKPAEQLQEAVHVIEAKKTEIADAWVAIPEVLEIFKKYGIGPKKFKEGFGLPIIEYFEVHDHHQGSTLDIFAKGAFLLDPFYLAGAHDNLATASPPFS